MRSRGALPAAAVMGWPQGPLYVSHPPGAPFRSESMTTWGQARELLLAASDMVAGGVLVFGRVDVGRQRARFSDERSQPLQQIRRVLAAAAGIEGQVPARHGRSSDYAALTVPTIRKNP